MFILMTVDIDRQIYCLSFYSICDIISLIIHGIQHIVGIDLRREQIFNMLCYPTCQTMFCMNVASRRVLKLCFFLIYL